MLRPITKGLMPLLVLALALSAPVLAIAADTTLLTLSIAAPHDLDTLLGDLAKAGDKPEKADTPRKMLTQMRLYEDNGLDTTKRFGVVVVAKEGAGPQPWALFPVKDEKQFFAALKPFFPTQEATKDGRTKLLAEGRPPLAVKVDKGYAFVTMFAEPAPPLPSEPEKLTAGKATIDLNVWVSAIPDAQKKAAIEQIKASAAQKEAAMTNEADKAKSRAGTQAFTAALEKFFATTDQVGLFLALSGKEFRLDFEMHNKAGTPDAKPADLAPLGLVKLVAENSAVGFTSDMSLDDTAKTALKDSAKNAFEAAKQGAGPPEKAKFLDIMQNEVDGLVKGGRVEGIAMFSGKKGDATFTGVIRTAADSKLGDAVKIVVDEAGKKNDKGPKPVVKTEGNVTYYTVDVPQNEKSAELGGHELGLGVRPGLVVMVFGNKTADKIKETLGTIDGLKPPAEKTIGSTKGWMALRAFADIFGVDTFAKTPADVELFNKVVTLGQDQFGFTLEPQKDGYKSGLYVQQGLVALICHAAVKDPAGAPGGPGAGPEPGGPPPPMPGESAAPAAPAPAESAAPSAAPSAEGSAAPEEKKEEGGEETPKRHEKEAGGDEKEGDK